MAKVKTLRNTPVKASARHKLEASQLRLDQMELMGKDVDLDAFRLSLRGIMPTNIVESITDARVSRTVRGASTLTVPVVDHDRKLLRSGILAHGTDVQVDGLWWRLKNIDKQDDLLNLTFEDRSIAVLRTYARPIKAGPATARTEITRAQFILRMLREVKEFKIPYVIPELTVIQPIGNSTTDVAPEASQGLSRNPGIPKWSPITVKGVQANPTQIKNANTMLDVAVSHVYPREICVMMIMAAIQESSITNLPQPKPGDSNFISVDPRGNPVGVLQQIKKWGWPATRDVATDTAEFLKRLSVQWNTVSGPRIPYYQLIENVQHSGHGQLYGQWRTEAERIVTAYGFPPATQQEANSQWRPTNVGGGNYEFYRGTPPVQGEHGWLPEDSWTCIGRLAQEVDFYAYFVSGTFYYMSSQDLFASKPRMRITEGVQGVDLINGTLDENSRVASLTVPVRMGRWNVPPGAIVELYDMGPWNGRWIVTQADRSLFNDQGEITLEKGTPKLPEPVSDGLSSDATAGWTPPKGRSQTDSETGQKYRTVSGLVQPVVKGKAKDPSHGGLHETGGLAGYPAYDFWGRPGDPVVAPENGTIMRFSGHDPALGPTDGNGNYGRLFAGGPLGWTIYLRGDSGADYFITHLNTRTCRVGQKVAAGYQIGTIADYDKWGRASHTHVGVNSGGGAVADGAPPKDTSRCRTIYELGNAPLAVGV